MLQLIRQALLSFFVKSSNALLAFLVTLLAAFWLSPENFGLFSVYQSIFVIVATFVLFGMDQELLRRHSKQVVSGSAKGLEEDTSFLHGAIAFIVFALACCAMFLAAFVYIDMIPARVAGLGIVFALSFVVCRVLRSIALAEGAVLGSQIPESLLQPLVAIAAIAYLIFGEAPETSVMAYQVIVASFVIAAAYLLALYGGKAFRLLRQSVGHFSRYALRNAAVAGLPFLFVALSNTLLSQIDILLLASLSGNVDAGTGRLLIRIADFASFGAMAAAIPISRWAANLEHLGNSDLAILRRKVMAISIAALVFSIVYSAAILLVSDALLAQVNPAYTGYRTELAVILLGRILFCFFGLPTVFLAMQGHVSTVVKCQLIGIVLNVLLSIALIPAFGLLGAAVATSFSVLVWKFLATRALEKSVGFNVSVTGLIFKEWSR